MVPDTPLFVKTHDFNLWLLQHTQRFPKAMRHSYTNRLEGLMLDFEEAILIASPATSVTPTTWCCLPSQRTSYGEPARPWNTAWPGFVCACTSTRRSFSLRRWVCAFWGSACFITGGV